jgi:5-methylcytosine-specific restriction endonuclease McrA
MKSKPCNKCEQSKPLDDFHRHRLLADGRTNTCKVCVSAQRKAYYRENRERISAYNREHYEKNAEARREARKKHYEENREAVLERQREYHRRHWPAIFAANAEYYREKSRRYHAEHPERTREYGARRRAAMAGGSVPKSVVRGLLKDPCAYCGSTEDIEIDHIIPLSRGGKHEPDNLAPACRSCNRSKGAKLVSEWKVAT